MARHTKMGHTPPPSSQRASCLYASQPHSQAYPLSCTSVPHTPSIVSLTITPHPTHKHTYRAIPSPPLQISAEEADSRLRGVVFEAWRRSGCESYEDTLAFSAAIDFFLPYFPLQREQARRGQGGGRWRGERLPWALGGGHGVGGWLPGVGCRGGRRKSSAPLLLPRLAGGKGEGGGGHPAPSRWLGWRGGVGVGDLRQTASLACMLWA